MLHLKRGEPLLIHPVFQGLAGLRRGLSTTQSYSKRRRRSGKQQNGPRKSHPPVGKKQAQAGELFPADELRSIFGHDDLAQPSPPQPSRVKIKPWMSLAERLQNDTPEAPSISDEQLPELSVPFDTEDMDDPSQVPGAETPTQKGSKKAAPGEEKNKTRDGEQPKKSKRKNVHAVASKIVTIIPSDIKNEPVETDVQLDVPVLQHKLDRVLFNPGVHVMRDARTRVYNFDPEVAKIMPADEFDYDALGEYITSSKDDKLRELCIKYEKKYCGSTSSLSSILAHFHYLISAWRKPNFSQLSQGIEAVNDSYTAILRSPAAAFAHYRDGTYAIDADKEHDVENILSSLGKSMEKQLLLPRDEYEKYRRSRSHEITEEQRNAGEAYHYSKLGDFLVRSQLDAYDPRLPGAGVFDIKTRAAISIRMDVSNWKKGTDYEINQLRGQWDSFEREYMDMIRAAFLKYSLQVRMGRMDGIFCAYHNTQRIFGFQYIPLSEMDVAIHGTDNTRLGDEEFRASLTIFNALLDRGTKRWPGRTLRLHVETRDTSSMPLMYFFIEPVTDAQMEATQSANKSSVAASAAKVFKNLKGLQESLEDSKREEESPADEEDQQPAKEPSGKADEPQQTLEADEVWDELESRIEDAVENDTNGLESVRAAVRGAMDRHGLLEAKPAAEVERSIDILVQALVDPRSDSESTSTLATAGVGESNSVEAESSQVSSDLEGESHNEETVSEASSEDVGAGSVNHDQSFVDEHEEPDMTVGDQTTSSTKNIADTAFETGTSLAEDNGRSDAPGLSLKELIFRAAENAEDKSRDLRAFDRIIAGLASEVKAKEDKRTLEAEEAAPEASKADGDASERAPPPDTEAPNATSDASEEQPVEENLLGMVVTVRNRTDNRVVHRPTVPYKTWTVGYSVTELPYEKALKVYRQIKNRRAGALRSDPNRTQAWDTMFGGDLRRATARGRIWRVAMEKEDKKSPTFKVAWDHSPQPVDKGAQSG